MISQRWRYSGISSHQSSSGQLGNCDMIGMLIATIWTESDDNIGFHSLQMSHDLRDYLGRPVLIQFTIQVIQEVDLVNTKHLGRCPQFSFASLAERLCSWILLFAP
jgi:hypothetical protein